MVETDRQTTEHLRRRYWIWVATMIVLAIAFAVVIGPRGKHSRSGLSYLCPKRATKNLTRLSWSNVETFENSGSATLSRSTRPDQGSVVPIVLAPHKLLERFGERGWNRTFNLLIPYQQPTSQWFQQFPMSFGSTNRQI